MLTWLIVWLVSRNIVSNELNICLMVIFHSMLHGCVCAGTHTKPKNNVISTNWFTSIKMQSQTKPKCANELLDTSWHLCMCEIIHLCKFLLLLFFFFISSARIDRQTYTIRWVSVWANKARVAKMSMSVRLRVFTRRYTVKRVRCA